MSIPSERVVIGMDPHKRSATIEIMAADETIHGGGRIFVAAQNALSASINGGGAIRYVGQPTVNTSIHGGGSVDSLR